MSEDLRLVIVGAQEALDRLGESVSRLSASADRLCGSTSSSISCPICEKRIPGSGLPDTWATCDCTREEMARAIIAWRRTALELGRDSIRDVQDWQAKAQAAGWRPPHV